MELKPCPFCGREAERKTNKRYRKGYIAEVGCVSQRCPAKVAQATIIGGPEYAYKHAEAAWNERKKIAKTIDEWHEDIGAVLWWSYPIEEPPYCGTPLDLEWPGYHTHWTEFEHPVPHPLK